MNQGSQGLQILALQISGVTQIPPLILKENEMVKVLCPSPVSTAGRAFTSHGFGAEHFQFFGQKVSGRTIYSFAVVIRRLSLQMLQAMPRLHHIQ